MATFTVRVTDPVRFVVGGLDILVDRANGELQCGEHTCRLPELDGDDLDFRIVLDLHAIEIFAGQGQVYCPLSLPQALGAANFQCTSYDAVRHLRVARYRQPWMTRTGHDSD